ncbi:ABC transporter permease [Parerythrobacter jejuensis]|uniref:ABC transporter permease n=1 Tax=Parerythrobacter jejuensis TaxID=795812 RepID=A0A845AWA3_9SPHN|nr:ABC transporter permease [Parerythrobacter jejuensis]MXP31059.1 ABC transporter permease [Parerythrobacter jejuensis]MXP33819.1 ABC transporter permease [Parerythrobacter jejuensis]
MSMDPSANSRLSLIQAAFVIARRDFLAILFSRAFLFFLLGPLFPIVVGGLAGGIGNQVKQEVANPELAVLMAPAERDSVVAAHRALAGQLGSSLPPLTVLQDDPGADPQSILAEKRANIAAILSGTRAEPVLTGPEDQLGRMQGRVALITATALGNVPSEYPEVSTTTVVTSGANERSGRLATAQAAQVLLFLLTMLLAGMVLSNLVEEKANKIIEILAASIPMDAVFFGKLFAMLGVSFVGIAVWGAVGGLIAQSTGFSLASFPAPAVGWPLFIALGIAYFAMAYLLLGSLFLAIGSLASTVREVQTLSMPVTMLQLLVFFAASFAIADQGSTFEWAAVIIPFSSPFAMLARAALQEGIAQHAIALLWQAFAVTLFVKAGATLFRKRVMKSGSGGHAKTGKKRWFGLAGRRSA